MVGAFSALDCYRDLACLDYGYRGGAEMKWIDAAILTTGTMIIANIVGLINVGWFVALSPILAYATVVIVGATLMTAFAVWFNTRI